MGPYLGQERMDAVHYAAALEEGRAHAILTYQVNPSRSLPEHVMRKHYERSNGAGAYYGQTKIVNHPRRLLGLATNPVVVAAADWWPLWPSCLQPTGQRFRPRAVHGRQVLSISGRAHAPSK